MCRFGAFLAERAFDVGAQTRALVILDVSFQGSVAIIITNFYISLAARQFYYALLLRECSRSLLRLLLNASFARKLN
jgi:hypothetical protein